ncbi:MAG: helix-turn-helix transcriptional regulator [Myxococcales bacterium]|nr:helix-turn-helix transcriptional regulator [Myxococcales bacterium]MCB9754482.1 helix-turn-helix transcriptional regulator [Myxococcales bacterium]
MTPEQCKAARALLNWGQAKLAEAAKCSQSTVARFEAKDPKHQIRPRTIESIRRTLEVEGIEFVENGRFGVVMRRDG